MAPAEGNEFLKALNSHDIKVKLDASLGEGSANRYYAIFMNKKNDKMLLVFNPTEQMQQVLKRNNMTRVQLGGN